MHHVLLDCPTWTEPRKELLDASRSKDLRKLLNDRKGAIAAIKFILHTDLLAQFRGIARQEQAKRLGQHQQPETEIDINSNWEEILLADISDSDSSQSESEDAGISQANHRQSAGFESP